MLTQKCFPTERRKCSLADAYIHFPIAALSYPHKCGSLRQHDSVIWWRASSRTEMGLWLLKSRYWRGSGVQPLPCLSERLRFYSLACVPSSNSGAAIFSCLCAAFCRCFFFKLKWLNVCICVCICLSHVWGYPQIRGGCCIPWSQSYMQTWVGWLGCWEPNSGPPEEQPRSLLLSHLSSPLSDTLIALALWWEHFDHPEWLSAFWGP